MPSTEDIIGGISAIIWGLTLLPLLKYVRSLLEQFFVFVYLTPSQVWFSLFFGTGEGLYSISYFHGRS